MLERIDYYNHKKKLEQLLYTGKVVDWFLADEDSEEFCLTEEKEAHPCLSMLRKVYPIHGPFADLLPSCRDGRKQGAVSLFGMIQRMAGSTSAVDDLYYDLRQSGWQASSHEATEEIWEHYQWHGHTWFCNSNDHREYFFLDYPSRGWFRYRWFAKYPRAENQFFLVVECASTTFLL